MTTDRTNSATGCPAGEARLESLAGVSFIDPADSREAIPLLPRAARW